MRVLPVAAITAFGLTIGLSANVAAQMLGPGMPVPGAAPPQQQQQMPPCFKDFAPLRAEAEKRAGVLKNAMAKRPEREVACNLIKSFAQAEQAVVRFVVKNAEWCGIPPQAAQQMKANHDRTVKTQNQICNGATAGPAKPTGPGLSEALGTARSPATIDPLAPKSGTLDTLTGNVLTR